MAALTTILVDDWRPGDRRDVSRRGSVVDSFILSSIWGLWTNTKPIHPIDVPIGIVEMLWNEMRKQKCDLMFHGRPKCSRPYKIHDRFDTGVFGSWASARKGDWQWYDRPTISTNAGGCVGFLMPVVEQNNTNLLSTWTWTWLGVYTSRVGKKSSEQSWYGNGQCSTQYNGCNLGDYSQQTHMLSCAESMQSI